MSKKFVVPKCPKCKREIKDMEVRIGAEVLCQNCNKFFKADPKVK